ncbi:MAG TPA: hypothetical protein VJV79_24815 [Polyangiaceae bacterium]|nr:hypothetical protein [Polyangiaceae bacterium]
MGSRWAKVSVVAIALAALGGCSDQEDPDDAQDYRKLYCNLRPPGVVVTVKGTAQYKLGLSGRAMVEGTSYSDGQQMVYVPNPQQPFSVTVKLEAGDLFQSLTDGYVVDPGSISADDTFSPADGSPKTESSQVCWNGVLQ